MMRTTTILHRTGNHFTLAGAQGVAFLIVGSRDSNAPYSSHLLSCSFHLGPCRSAASYAGSQDQACRGNHRSFAGGQRPSRAQVVLYKNGVGYFEHAGTVLGNQRVAIDFTSPQLNDVLQSLTVLDDGGGRIGGVNYNSTTPLAEQLKSLSWA